MDTVVYSSFDYQGYLLYCFLYKVPMPTLGALYFYNIFIARIDSRAVLNILVHLIHFPNYNFT